jgi:hypothetical protein
LKHVASIFCMVTITLAILPISLVRSQETETNRDLGITPLLERKDTYMLDLECPLSGPYAWDIPHENRSATDSQRCIKAAVAMVNSYYGGNLSQDRIAYYVYHDFLQYPSPENDLGHGLDVIGIRLAWVLTWALNGSPAVRYSDKPGFSDIKYWIDNNRPVIRDNPENHLITVIDGYDTNGQMVYVIDPLDGSRSPVPYDTLGVYVVWVPVGDNITARSDEPTIWMDSDRDGVVDFDEINRFHTDPYNNDTYGLGINDKTMIEYLYIDHLFGTPSSAGITISDLTASKSRVAQGYNLQINTTAYNPGDSAEAFSITTYANGTAIDTKEITVMNGSSTPMTFNWNTTGFAYGSYTINAYATPVPREPNITGNNVLGDWVSVTIPGDLNGDFRVSLSDLVILAKPYGSNPSDTKWNPNADIDGDGVIGRPDLVILAQNYGEHYP